MRKNWFHFRQQVWLRHLSASVEKYVAYFMVWNLIFSVHLHRPCRQNFIWFATKLVWVTLRPVFLSLDSFWVHFSAACLLTSLVERRRWLFPWHWQRFHFTHKHSSPAMSRSLYSVLPLWPLITWRIYPTAAMFVKLLDKVSLYYDHPWEGGYTFETTCDLVFTVTQNTDVDCIFRRTKSYWNGAKLSILFWIHVSICGLVCFQGLERFYSCMCSISNSICIHLYYLAGIS